MLLPMQKIAIIIPCFNEQYRIKKNYVSTILEQHNVDVYLCNDGSTDDTLQVLNTISNVHPGRCLVINYERNTGKANTIYTAAGNLLLKGGYTHIAYFDADFSTPPGEIVRMLNFVNKNPDVFVVGSRVQLLNAVIQRKWYRHIIGRLVVTIVNFKFRLDVYDTQCGAKIFPVAMAGVAFSTPFLTSWLFDMEIFIRLRKAGMLAYGKELPLRYWTDVDGSKLKLMHAFSILKEIVVLYKIKEKRL